MHVTTEDLAERWNFNDLVMANEVLDALEAAEERAMNEAKRG